MRKEIVDILCCPKCKSELKLEINKEYEEEILQGFLICKKCNRRYSINEGIPNLLIR